MRGMLIYPRTCDAELASATQVVLGGELGLDPCSPRKSLGSIEFSPSIELRLGSLAREYADGCSSRCGCNLLIFLCDVLDGQCSVSIEETSLHCRNCPWHPKQYHKHIPALGRGTGRTWCFVLLLEVWVECYTDILSDHRTVYGSLHDSICRNHGNYPQNLG